MKILLNFATLGREGIDVPRLLKFRELNKSGCELYLFSGKFIRKIEPAGKDVYSFNETISELRSYPERKWTKVSFMLYALKMNLRSLSYLRKIKKDKYDVIYSPAAVLDLTLFPYLYKLFHKNIKWAVVFDNIVPMRDPGNKIIRFLAWLFFRMSLAMARKADAIFVISEDLRDYLLKKYFSPEKIVLSANGIDNELIEKARPDEKYKIDAVFMGRINETKGIYDMLKVLDIVRRKYPDFQLAFMGEGDETTKKRFRKKINEMGLENNVRFWGFRTGVEKFNILKSAKCFWFLSVSESESFGVSLLEAVCCGLPAFAHNLPQLMKIYRNGEVDFSPKGSYKLVAQKIIRLFERGDFANEKGKMLLNKYSWEKVAETEHKAIEKILSNE